MKYIIIILAISNFGTLYLLNHSKGLEKKNTQTITTLQNQVNKYKDTEIQRNNDLIEAQDKANQASADYEQLKAERAKAAEKNRSELQTIVTRDVYHFICFDDDGLHNIQDRITKGNASLAR